MQGVTLIDASDDGIVNALLADGRASVRSIADQIGLPESTTRLRLARLLKSGAVTVRAMAHPEAVGVPTMFFIAIDFSGDPEQLVSDSALQSAPYVLVHRNVSQLTAQMAAGTVGDIAGILDELRSDDRIIDLSSEMILRVHSGPEERADRGWRPGVWERPAIRDLKPDDLALIEFLKRDGRASYTTLATATGLSITAVRRRVLSFEEAGVIRYTTIVENPGVPVERGGVVLKLAPGRQAAAIQELCQMPGVSVVTETTGPFGVSTTVRAPSEEVLESRMGDITKMEGVLASRSVRFDLLRDSVGWTPLPPLGVPASSA